MSKKKTASKMLKGLKGVTVENFDQYLQKSGVIVTPHIGRQRKKFAMPKELMGIKDDDAKEFYKEYINGSSLSLLSKEDEKTLAAIESSVRQSVKRFAIGYDGKYIPVETYKDAFLPIYNEKKEAYFEKRDEIGDRWESIVNNFSTKLTAFLNTCNITDAEKVKIKNDILNNIPSKNSFLNSFYMDLSLSAFPVIENLSLLDESVSDDVKESIKKQSIHSLYEILGNLMSDTFDTINSFLVFYNENGELSRKFNKTLIDLRCRITKNNILKHPIINKVVKNLKELEMLNDEDERAEMCETILARIYGFAKEIDVLEYLNLSESVLDEETLNTLSVSVENA